jgi:predicted kinase
MNKPVCTVMVGLPASGKSTRVRELVTMNPEAFVYSTDAEIERRCAFNGWTYDQGFAEFVDPATKYMNEQLEIAVRSKQDVIWDQTNLGAKKRAKIVNRMKNAGYRVECEYILFPQGDSQWEDWNWRHKSRVGKTIPSTVLESMMDSFVTPLTDEGFDAVYCFDMYGNLINC